MHAFQAPKKNHLEFALKAMTASCAPTVWAGTDAPVLSLAKNVVIQDLTYS